MIKISQLREYMKKQAVEDRKTKTVHVNGSSLEEALKKASIELNVPVKKLEYEVLIKGSPGVLGVGKKNWNIIAYVTVEQVSISSIDEDLDDILSDESDSEDLETDRDGKAVVKLMTDGVYIKIIPPSGSGRKVKLKEAIQALHTRSVHTFDNAKVEKALDLQSEEFVQVGEFLHNPANDSIMTVDISDMEMKAYLTVRPPGPGGADVTYDEMISFLKNNGVVNGIKEEVLAALDLQPEFTEPILVAEGAKPVNGDDAKIVYNFETDRSKIQLKEKNGKVDFKELNLIQNVVEGQALAMKVPAAAGKTGMTVTGKSLPAKDGKDISINLGKNVAVADDRKTVVATASGQVLLANGKISVETILVIPGDVNTKTGNIRSLGAVFIKGNVEDGFSVEANGNIEVMGNVGKASLDTNGDIIVHQGINGSEGQFIKAGKSLWSKYIQNAAVEVEEYIITSDGIMNSNVNANKKVLCKGKRAYIVGGHLRAAEEINARTIGSINGVETILEVGYDPEKRARLEELKPVVEEKEQELEEVELNVQNLMKQKKAKKTLSKEKQEQLGRLMQEQETMNAEVEQLRDEVQTIEKYLSDLKNSGRVSASGKVHPGVQVIIKEAELRVQNEFQSVTFIQEGNTVKVTKYEDFDDDISRG